MEQFSALAQTALASCQKCRSIRGAFPGNAPRLATFEPPLPRCEADKPGAALDRVPECLEDWLCCLRHRARWPGAAGSDSPHRKVPPRGDLFGRSGEAKTLRRLGRSPIV